MPPGNGTTNFSAGKYLFDPNAVLTGIDLHKQACRDKLGPILRMGKNMRFTSIVLLGLILLFGCRRQSAPSYTVEQIDSLKNVFQKHVRTLETEFRTAEWSPLSPDDKAAFDSLKYFPYDITWRFTGAIVVYKQPDSLTIRGSKAGDLRPALRYGYFPFERDGQTYKLDVIKMLPSKPGQQAHLFLGFWDETSDVQTYGGGRYINLEQQADGRYVVDFNYAYNPYCAYSDRYSCAIPPLTNRLPIAVPVGELKYHEHH